MKKVETEPCLYGTDWQLSEGKMEGLTGWKKVKGLAKEWKFITYRHRQHYDDGWPEGRWYMCIEGSGQIGGNGSICKSVKDKNKVKYF